MAFNILTNTAAAVQNKYNNDVKKAYIMEKDVRPIQKYMKKGSTTNAGYITHYTAGRLYASEYQKRYDRTPAVGISGAAKPGDALIPSVQGIEPVNQVDIFTGHRMSFKKIIAPYWLLEDDIEKTEVYMNDSVKFAQVQGIIRQEEADMLTKFDQLLSGTYVATRAHNSEDFLPVTVTIPAGNVQGDATKVVDTTENWQAFRNVTVKAASMTNGRFAILTGQTGYAKILNTEKTESRDYNPQGNSVVTGKIAPMLFGGEVFVFPQFDEVFDIQSSGIVPYIILCDQAAAYDRPTEFLRTVFEYDVQRMGYYFNAILRYNMMFIDEEGVFVINTKL